jgi:hypothetical protein
MIPPQQRSGTERACGRRLSHERSRCDEIARLAAQPGRREILTALRGAASREVVLARGRQPSASSGHVRRFPKLFDSVIGVATGNLQEFLVGRFLSRDAEPLRRRVPFRRRLLQGGLWILPAPYGGAHPVYRQRIVLPARHDHVDNPAVRALAKIDQIVLGGGPKRAILLRLVRRQAVGVAQCIRQHGAETHCMNRYAASSLLEPAARALT